MNKDELIKSLIEETNNLTHRDYIKLDALKRRSEMIIRKVFGDTSDYLNNLNKIRFYPLFGPSNEPDKDKAWNSGKEKMLNFLNVMLEDIELSNNFENEKKEEKIINNNPNVFISYVKENSNLVDNLQSELESKGIEVWRDIKDLYPGDLWKSEIRKAIQKGNYFIACFSKEFCEKEKTYMNEELIIAIDELRLRPTDKAWFIPILLTDCDVPDRDIGGGKTLRDIQFVKLIEDWDTGIERIVKVIYRHKRNGKQYKNEEIKKKELKPKEEKFDKCPDLFFEKDLEINSGEEKHFRWWFEKGDNIIVTVIADGNIFAEFMNRKEYVQRKDGVDEGVFDFEFGTDSSSYTAEGKIEKSDDYYLVIRVSLLGENRNVNIRIIKKHDYQNEK